MARHVLAALISRFRKWPNPESARQVALMVVLVIAVEVVMLVRIARQPLSALGVISVTSAAFLLWPEIIAALRGVEALRRVLEAVTGIERRLRRIWGATAAAVGAGALAALVLPQLQVLALTSPTGRAIVLVTAVLAFLALLGAALEYVLWSTREILAALVGSVGSSGLERLASSTSGWSASYTITSRAGSDDLHLHRVFVDVAADKPRARREASSVSVAGSPARYAAIRGPSLEDRRRKRIGAILFVAGSFLEYAAAVSGH
jgi:hypothetical protein